MNVFRRQGDISSESSEEDVPSTRPSSGNHHGTSPSPSPSIATVDGEDERVNASSESGTYSNRSVLIADLQSGQGVGAGANIDGHRNMIMASLLEEHYKVRAADLLNAAYPGHNYSRDSPEVQPLAEELFRKGGQYLSENGVLDLSSTSDTERNERRRYLSGLDNLAVARIVPTPDLLHPMRNLAIRSARPASDPPTSDLHLNMRLPHPSHYQANFREVRLLGRGGFGKVFGCYNLLDQRTYAVKKIQLSRKITARLSEDKHEEMEALLREVKAMARLDHVNVVRYHATWIEQPRNLPIASEDTAALDSVLAITTGPGQPRLLLDSRPFNTSLVPEPSFSDHSEKPVVDNNIEFCDSAPSHTIEEESEEFDEPERQISGNGMLADDATEMSLKESSSEESSSGAASDSAFTDGKGSARSDAATSRSTRDERPVLYIQMTLYPMTLTEYISPPDFSNQPSSPRHCFHLVPTLRLILSILDGLQYIHANGLIHRDIKPGNIFLSKPEVVFRNGYSDVSCQTCLRDNKPFTRWLNPRIGDFGLVTQLASEGLIIEEETGATARPHERVGTVNYRPPVWNGGRSGDDSMEHNLPRQVEDEKTDIYALGVIFMEMLWECGTKMERAEMLTDLQKEILPRGLQDKLEGEGFDTSIVEDTLALARAMVNPNPAQRWFGGQVRDTIIGLLDRI